MLSRFSVRWDIVLKKSIFLRFFLTVGATFLVLLIGLFLVLYGIMYERSTQSEWDEMEQTVDIIREYYIDAYDGSLTSVRTSMYAMATKLGGRLFITNTSGTTIICTEVYPCTHVYTNIQQHILDTAKSEGKHTEIGHMDGVYSSEFFTCGKPMYNENGECIGFVFVSKNTKAVYDLLSDLTWVFLLTLIFALVFTYIILYLLMDRLTRPIRTLTGAANKLADGDFSSRVTVVGQDELAQLGKTFNNMADSLESLEKMRSSFVANVSHELKTPMTSMSGFVDGILDGTIPPEKQHYYLEIVSSETKRLARLVKTLLYLSKIEAGEESANISDFNYADVVTDVVVSLEPRLSERKMEIEGLDWDKVINTRADRDMIYQVTYNLLENAIKYAPEGGTITFLFETQGNKQRIAIRNPGAISKKDCKHLFERFYKVDKSRGLDSKSTGLGLYLVYTLLKIHDQTVTVDSDNSTYVEFSFTLPAI